MTANKTLMDLKQAAAYLTISTDVLRDEVTSGRVVGFKIGGKWKFDKIDIDAYVDAKRHEAVMRAKAAKKEKKNVRSFKKSGAAESTISPYWLPGMKIQDNCAPLKGGQQQC